LVGCKIKNFDLILSKVGDDLGAAGVPVGTVLAASLVRQLEEHQYWERHQFLRVIAQAALSMDDAQRVGFLRDVFEVTEQGVRQLETICQLALKYSAGEANPVTEFAESAKDARRDIEQRYLHLIMAAGSTKVTARRAA
jgi:hypothetical protein